jgi:hypothetical protein
MLLTLLAEENDFARLSKTDHRRRISAQGTSLLNLKTLHIPPDGPRLGCL